MRTFNEVFEDKTKYGTKLKTDEYQKRGIYLIIDQGQKLIAGYTNQKEGVFEDVPAIIFGDHTRTVKYVEVPFFIGADGVKILKCRIRDANYKYLYYALKNAEIPDTGYNRHFKWLKEVTIRYPNSVKQQKIVDVLGKVEEIIIKQKQQIERLDNLIKSRFVEMFGDVRYEPKYHGIPLRKICTTISGGTPSTKFPEYYEGDIPWISTVSLGPNHIDGTNAKGYITEEAIANSATKLIPANNILFGTRVGVGKSSLNDVDICTNQDIIAIIGIDESKFSRLFIKHVLDWHQPYFDSIKKGATILGIRSDDLKDVFIPQVSIDLQRKYEVFVEQVDQLKSKTQKSLDKTQLLFNSLMQQYFG